MKLFKNKSVIALFGLAVLSISCSNDIVDTTPYNNVGETTAFSSPALIQLAVNGVYNAAQIGVYNGTGGRGYLWGAAFTEQNEARGEDVVNTQAFYQITYEGTYDPTTANNVYYWVDGYRMINRANLVIDGVTKALQEGIISEAVANKAIGEMLFLRAITHYEFVKHYSKPYHLDNGASMGVPYRVLGNNNIPAIEEASKLDRGTVANVYAKALEDLDRAESLLSGKAITTVSKGATSAYKMRIYASKRDWSKVLSEFDKIKGTYTLTATQNAVFGPTNSYNNTESIFSIGHSADTNAGVNAALPNMFKQRAMLAISPILWRNKYWLEDDKRRALTTTVSGVKYTDKYTDTTNFTDATPILRFADMVLLAAEANARLGNSSEAVKLLNSVRNRSLASPTTQAYTDASFADKKALVEAIIAERRIELLCEGSRWQDIHRLINDDLVPMQGIPGKVANGVPAASNYTLGTEYSGPLSSAIPYTDKRFLWPLPFIETSANPVLAAQQNPGY